MRQPAPGRSVADLYPALAREADGWDPSEVSAGSRRLVNWRCAECDAEWTSEVRARAHGHRSCPECGRLTHPPLSQTHPVIAAQMLPPHSPDDFTHGSKQRVRWRGPQGHEWEASIANRTKGSGCPVCSRGAGGRARQRPEPGGSLADTHPALAAEADGWDPSAYRPGSSARLPWRCSTCGRQWESTVFRRTRGASCPACRERVRD
jgi:DNA-directed RNA polymerase subunit RPC12/RpoP